MSKSETQLDLLYPQASHHLAQVGYAGADEKAILVVALYELKAEFRKVFSSSFPRTRKEQAKDWGVKGGMIALLVSLVELVQRIG